jgi:hypothetical protein
MLLAGRCQIRISRENGVITRFNGNPSKEYISFRTIADGCGSGGALESFRRLDAAAVRERAGRGDFRIERPRTAEVSHIADSAIGCGARPEAPVQSVAECHR